jgi:hypothetical protein
LSELPERKVLKNTLMKLKSNVIRADETYDGQIKGFNEVIFHTMQGLNNIKASGADAQAVGGMIILVGTIAQAVQQLVKQSLETINHWRTYTEVLENYSAELDSTLTKIFEDAVKQSEEQSEKQKELFKGQPDAYTK